MPSVEVHIPVGDAFLDPLLPRQSADAEEADNEESEDAHFLYLCFAQTLLLDPNGGQDGTQMTSKIDFYSD